MSLARRRLPLTLCHVQSKPEGPKGATQTTIDKLLKLKTEAKAAARTTWGSATAYMLVYRRQEATPPPSVSAEDVPAELRETVAKENAEFARERAEYRAKADQLIIKVLHKADATGFTVTLDKHQPLSALMVRPLAPASFASRLPHRRRS